MRRLRPIEQDLSDLDFSQFKPISFEFSTRAAQINLRVPRPLLDAVKVRARGTRHAVHTLHPRADRARRAAAADRGRILDRQMSAVDDVQGPLSQAADRFR